MRSGEIHRLSVLLFTDIVGSVRLQEQLGTQVYAALLKRHDDLFREAIANSSGRILKHTGDGFLAEFSMSSEAVATGLRFQYLLHHEPWAPQPLQVRVGMHQGEVMVVEPADLQDASPLAVGMAVNLAARVMDLAAGKQILLSRPVYENARYYLKDEWKMESASASDLRWIRHGPYQLKGAEEPMEIFEVGIEGVASLTPPEGSLKATRVTAVAEENPAAPNYDALKSSDVLISYASLDNEPLAHGERGWVTRLHQALQIRLGQLLGRQASVWRDPKVTRCDEWNDQLGQSLTNVRAMVPVVSPPYLQAESCSREMQAFIDADGGVSKIIVQAIKTPVEAEQLPPRVAEPLQETSRIHFYEEDANGRLTEFDDSLGEESRSRFLHSVYDLAYEISRNVKGDRQAAARKGDEKTIYLAEATREIRSHRDQIRRELLERGYRVLPEKPLPLFADDLRRRTREEMEEAHAIVHLIGSRYGIIPEDSERSLAEMQCLISSDVAAERQTPRFVWAPQDLEFQDRRQEGFFQALEKGDFGMEQTEFVRGSVEELKRLTLIALTKEPEPVSASESAGSHVKMVYVIADPNDEASVEPLEDHLYQLGYEVKVLSDEGDPRLTAEVHRQILTVCDGVLIYFGEGSSQWVEMNLMDIMKAPAFGRNRPLDAQAVYLAPPFNRRKERFRSRSALVMRNGGAGFSPDALSPFLDQLGPPKRS